MKKLFLLLLPVMILCCSPGSKEAPVDSKEHSGADTTNTDNGNDDNGTPPADDGEEDVPLPAGTLTLSLSADTKAITPHIFGYNTQTIHGPGWNDPDFLKAIEELDPGNFRYPGGTVANFWNWRTGDYLDVYLDGAIYRPVGYRNGIQYPYTFEDVKGVYDRGGGHAMPIYVINVLTSTIEEQIASLQYAQSIGLPVKYIEMGNEIYLDDSQGDKSATIYLQKFPFIRNYADTCLRWTKRFRQAFPAARIALVGVANPDSWNRARAKAWNDSLVYYMNHGFGDIVCDAMVVHDYAKNNFNPVENMKGVDMISQMVNAGSGPKVQHPSIPQQYALWVTEYNMESGNSILACSWAHGLGAVLMSAQIVVTPQVELQCFFNLAGSESAAAIFDRDYTKTDTNAESVQAKKDSLSAAGRTLAMLSAALKEATSVRTVAFSQNPTVKTQKSGNMNTLWGYAFGSAVQPALLLVNVGAQTQKVALKNLGFTPRSTRQLWAPTLETPIVWGRFSMESADVPANTVVELRPWSVTVAR